MFLGQLRAVTRRKGEGLCSFCKEELEIGKTYTYLVAGGKRGRFTTSLHLECLGKYIMLRTIHRSKGRAVGRPRGGRVAAMDEEARITRMTLLKRKSYVQKRILELAYSQRYDQPIFDFIDEYRQLAETVTSQEVPVYMGNRRNQEALQDLGTVMHYADSLRQRLHAQSESIA